MSIPPHIPSVPDSSNGALQIRRGSLADIETLVSLNAHVQSPHARAHPELFRAQPPPSEIAAAFRKMIDDPAAVWLIAETNTPAGYLYAQFLERPESWFRPTLRVCNISHLSIQPGMRRKGVARQLLSAIIAEAETRGFARIELDVWSFNQAARTVFTRLGFTVFNERMMLERTAPLARPSEIAR